MFCSRSMPPVLLLFLVVSISGPVASAQSDPFAAHIRPTEPLSPQDEQKSFKLPAGFRIELFASEPQIHKPLNMAFDDRGRLWVTETVEYPYPAPPDRPGRDRIRILEDTDGDGRADRVTTFADGLNIPIGIYPIDDGAIVFSIPYIWRLRDTDGDGRADQRTRLYGPFDYSRDTHGLNNAFRRSFDGWFYACHGFSNHSRVAGTDGHVADMTSGNVYRFRLDGSHIEVFTHGQVNPFGMAIDRTGEIFTADCHSKPLTQLLQGGYYPSFGRPHDGLGFVPPIMSHLHGSTAIAGAAWCNGFGFPPSFADTLFCGNVMTSRVNHDRLKRVGATVIAEPLPDFLVTSDPWFRPVDLQFGPRGALFVADFYNRIIGHYEVPLDHPGRDRKRGRIWRITYRPTGEPPVPAPVVVDLARRSIDELIEQLDHPLVDRRLRALHQLVDRFGATAHEPIIAAWKEATSRQRVGLVWAAARTGLFQRDRSLLQDALHDRSSTVRMHAWRAVAEQDWGPAGSPDRLWLTKALEGIATPPSDARIERRMVEAAARHPDARLAHPLLLAWKQTAGKDPMLEHSIKIALRNVLETMDDIERRLGRLSDGDRRRLASVAIAAKTQASAEFLLNSLDRGRRSAPEEALAWVAHIARYGTSDLLVRLVRVAQEAFSRSLDTEAAAWLRIDQSLSARGDVADFEPLRGWAETLVSSLITAATGKPKHAAWMVDAAAIARRAKLERFASPLLEGLERIRLDGKQRRQVLLAIVSLRPIPFVPQLLPVLESPLTTEAQRLEIERLVKQSMAGEDRFDAAAAGKVFERLIVDLPSPVQRSVVLESLGRPETTSLVVELWKSGKLPAALFFDPRVAARVDVVLPGDEVSKLRSVLPRPAKGSGVDAAFLAAAAKAVAGHKPDAEKGRRLFDRHCAACHQLTGKGEMIAPQLDGIGKRGIARLIEDVLAPNQNVDPKFRTTILQLDDGRVVTGLERRRDGKQIVMADATGKEFRVDAASVEASRQTSLSLMPDNFRETIPLRELLELLSFLARQ